MPDKPAAVRVAIEAADVDALAMAYLLSIVEVLLREGVAQANRPRVERLLEMAAVLNEVRERAIKRKEGL